MNESSKPVRGAPSGGGTAAVAETGAMPPAPAQPAPAQPAPAKPAPAKPTAGKPTEIGGPKGLDPVRYGDWERDGRCVDF